ncbi:hypothetical protein L1887_58181 [Cichorium endivia]|nr:hypothetical protein L1887_58181 [Cichorium endivia]
MVYGGHWWCPDCVIGLLHSADGAPFGAGDGAPLAAGDLAEHGAHEDAHAVGLDGNGNVDALIADLVHAANDSGGARSEHLCDLVLFGLVHDLVHGHLAFGHGDALGLGEAVDGHLALLVGAQEREDRVARHTGQDGAVIERGGGDLVVGGLAVGRLVAEDDKEVHGAHLGELPVGTKQPEHLVVALLERLHGGLRGAGVVGGELVAARSAGPGTHDVGAREQADGLGARAGRVVVAYGAADAEELRLGGDTHAERVGRADERGAQVERLALAVRHIVAVEADERLDELDELVAVKGGQASTGSGSVHALHVLVGAEESDLARTVGGAVGLHALEQAAGVVERGRGRRERERAVRLDVRHTPAGLVVPVDNEHVRRELLAKDEVVKVGRSRRLVERDLEQVSVERRHGGRPCEGGGGGRNRSGSRSRHGLEACISLGGGG